MRLSWADKRQWDIQSAGAGFQNVFKMFSKCFQNAAWHEGNSFSSHAQTKNLYCYLYFYCPFFKTTNTTCLLRDYTSDYKVARHYNLERNYPEDRFSKKRKLHPLKFPLSVLIIILIYSFSARYDYYAGDKHGSDGLYPCSRSLSSRSV